MSSNNYAGFWLRFAAYIIDYILLQIVQSLIILPILAVFGISFATYGFDFQNMSEEEMIGMIIAFVSAMASAALLTTILLVLYYSLMESSKYQATLGKLAVGLKVTDMDGQRLSFAKALLRQLAKILSAMILLIGYIMAGFTDKKQALHDMIAGALVVKK